MAKSMQKIVIISCLYFATNIYAARDLYNEVDYPLYVAGYHAGDKVERVTDVKTLSPANNLNIDVPATKLFSTRKRYIVIARTKEALTPTMNLSTLKSFIYIDMSNPSLAFYLVEKNGRLKFYTQIEYSALGKLARSAKASAKEAITEMVINKEELAAVTTNPHRKEVATVRTSNTLPAGEQEYLKKRMPKVQKGLEKYIGRSLEGKKAPKIAFVASGGGNRAMYASCGFFLGAQETGLLDAGTYISALSGSTWFLGSWFASKEPNIEKFKESFVHKMENGLALTNSHELSLIIDAIKIKIAYGQPISSMDLYGALLGNALLSDFGDARYKQYLSHQSEHLKNGDWIFPIYNAVDGSMQTHQQHKWYEFTPFEVGASWLGCYIPTWAYGRQFVKGSSITDDPEIPLAFLFGTFGSAFAVDVMRVWQETLEMKGGLAVVEVPVRKLILNRVGDRRFTKIEEYNFSMGVPVSPLRDRKLITLVDAGLSFNLPYPAISGERPDRSADIIIFFDSSADVEQLKNNSEKAAKELRKVADYAKKNNLKFPIIDRIIPSAINIYKDEKDSSVPLVIWMPLMKDESKWSLLSKDPRFANLKDFEISTCIAKDFCTTINFKYTAEQAQTLISLGQCNIYACRQEITDAITWKLDHM